MAFKQPSGCGYTSTTTGTGDIALDGSTIAGMTSLVSKLATNDVTYVRVRMGDVWEHLKVTRLSSPNRLRVDEIVGTSTGGTDKIDWAAGTKTVTVVPLGEMTPSLQQENSWGADQHFAGYKVTLHADKTSYMISSTQGGVPVIDFYIGGALSLRTKAGEMRLIWSDAGAGAGPDIVGDRASASPAAADKLTRFLARGRNSAAESIDYFEIRSEIAGAADGSESGRTALGVIGGGTWVEQLVFENGRVSLPAGVPLYIGKNSAASATVGHEFRANGSAFHTGDGAVPLYLDYKSAAGTVTMLQFRRSNSDAGSIVTTASAISLAQPSDRKLKKEIGDWLGAGSVLDRLRPRMWTWRETGKAGFGLIAQEVAKVLPELVHKDGKGILHVLYDQLIPWLLAETIDHRRREKALEARVARLERALRASEASE